MHNHEPSEILGAETAEDYGEHVFITFKFGGHWVNVHKQSRRKYKGGKQKTIKFDKSKINLIVLRSEVEKICPWVKGHSFDLHYHISGTTPKEYNSILSDPDIIEMLHPTTGSCHTELVVSTLAEINSQHSFLGGSGIANHGNISNVVEEPINDNICASHISSENHEDSLLCIGARFSDAIQFKQTVRTQAIRQNYGVVISASNKKRVVAVCSSEGCTWRVRATLCADGETFEVRKLCGSHSCPGMNRSGNRQASVCWVANEIQDIVKKHPEIPPKQINSNLESTYGLSLPYMRLWRSREHAREMIFGSVDDNYRWVPALAEELKTRNPGSHIIYDYDRHDNSFKRFFVSFKVCTEGFLAGCRHLLGLDACLIKSKYLGMLLSAVSLDGNNCLFTVAYAVVETESKETWKWFLENLQESFRSPIYPLAFIFDMEKGLGEAIKLVFPHAEHRVCLRHLWKNLKKQFRFQDGHKAQNLFWAAAGAYTEDEFVDKVGELNEISPQACSYLLALPYFWSRKKRFRHFLEESSGNKRGKHKCSRCGIWGHHRNSCKNPLTSTTQTSQPCSADLPSKPRTKLAITRPPQNSTSRASGVLYCLVSEPISESFNETYAFW